MPPSIQLNLYYILQFLFRHLSTSSPFLPPAYLTSNYIFLLPNSPNEGSFLTSPSLFTDLKLRPGAALSYKLMFFPHFFVPQTSLHTSQCFTFSLSLFRYRYTISTILSIFSFSSTFFTLVCPVSISHKSIFPFIKHLRLSFPRILAKSFTLTHLSLFTDLEPRPGAVEMLCMSTNEQGRLMVGSQFFIHVKKYSYTHVFAYVIDGLDLVDK